MTLYLVSENALSEDVMKRLVSHNCPARQFIFHSLIKRGRGNIKKKFHSYNTPGNPLPFFVLVDLDTDRCAPELIDNWTNRPLRQNLIFRVAEREVESWLLADTEGFCEFTGVPHDLVRGRVSNPDNLESPKETLISLVNRSRRRELKRDIVRESHTSFKQGPAYNTRLGEYVFRHWDVSRAAEKSSSLNRACNALRNFRKADSN